MISYFYQDIDFELSSTDSYTKWIEAAVEEEFPECRSVKLNYIFCNDAYILEVNRRFLNHDYFTDIITFNYNRRGAIAGDLFISIDTIRANAKEYSESFESELLRVMIHGVLHLLGYDDMNEDEKIVMRERENYYINRFVANAE